MKKCFLVLSIMLALMLAIGCAESSTDYEEGNVESAEGEAANYEEASAEPAEAATEEVPILEITSHQLGKEEYGGYYVSGTAVSSQDLSYAEVKAKFYGPDGALVESSLDNINDLEAGEPWNFKVICLTSDQRITDYKIAAGSCF